MIGTRISLGKKHKDEGEKPFWISFSDLMTALMVLFLLVMSVALLSVTKTVTDAEREKLEMENDIESVMNEIEQSTKDFPGITIDKKRGVIDFGDKARFDTGSSSLTAQQGEYLRAFIPGLLQIANGIKGTKWLKRFVVEGFTDERGEYLMNLNLSLQRSQRVITIVLAPPSPGAVTFTTEQIQQIKEKFLVGGFSSNSAKKSYEESRRIEIRIECYSLEEKKKMEAAKQ